MKLQEAIIFDMDGVLVDSVKYLYEAFNLVLNKYNVHIRDEDVKKYLGKSMNDKIKMWKEDYNIKEDINIAEFSKEVFDLEMKLLKENLKENIELINLMNVLKENDFKLAVATSSPKSRSEKILDLIGIKDELDIIITSEDFKKSKPHPEVFMVAAKKLNILSKDCIVVEDAVNGIDAAKKAGMKAIALLTKFHDKEDFKDADLIINSLSELNLDNIRNLK